MGPRPLPLLLLALLLPGCAGIERGFSRLTDGLTDFSGRYGPQWGGMRAASPGDSLTVQRVRAGGVAPDPAAALRPEPGDQVRHRPDIRRGFHLLLCLADPLANPGEIHKLHLKACRR